MSKLRQTILIIFVIVSLYSLYALTTPNSVKADNETHMSETLNQIACVGGIDLIRQCWHGWKKLNPTTECTSNPNLFLWINWGGEMTFYDSGSVKLRPTGDYIVTSHCTTKPAPMGLTCYGNCY